MLGQGVNLLHPDRPVDEAGDPKERVDMDFIIIEKTDLFQMGSGDKIEDVCKPLCHRDR